jgi:Peptidase family M1 domain
MRGVLATCPQPPPLAAPAPDRPRYAVDVVVTRPFREITGNVRVTFTPNLPTDHLVFRLWPNGPAQRDAGEHLDVGPVKEDGRELHVLRPNPTTLRVELGRMLGPGSHVTVQLPWRLMLGRSHIDRNARFRGGLRLGTFFPLLSWDPRRGWLTDPASRLYAETAATPTADFDLRVRAPAGLRVLATGDSAGPGHFRAHAVRDLAVAVGPFRVESARVGRVTVHVAALAGSRGRHAVMSIARHALRALSARFGAYPWRSYTLVLPPDLPPSGIEYPMLAYIGSSRYARLIVDHETAHQWFYSLVGNDQARDPWLDETLATWSQTRLGSREPPRNGRVPKSVQRHVGAPVSYWEARGDWYYFGVYGEGVSALRSLGDAAAVDCALRHYVALRAYSIAQPGDLLDELNRFIPGAERRLRAWGIHR